MQPLQILLTAALMLAVCAVCTLFMGCQRIIDRAESALECDEEVDIDFKFKVDFKDKAERDNAQLKQSNAPPKGSNEPLSEATVGSQ